jgi:hypothetical protein
LLFLEAAGFSKEQARTLVDTLYMSVLRVMATKEDLKELANKKDLMEVRNEITKLEVNLTKQMYALHATSIAIIVGVVVALLKF